MTCMRPYDVPDVPLEPPDDAVPRRWCDRCAHWSECPCGCWWGWCSYADEFTYPDYSDDCGDFDGEPPDPPDPPDPDDR